MLQLKKDRSGLLPKGVGIPAVDVSRVSKTGIIHREKGAFKPYTLVVESKEWFKYLKACFPKRNASCVRAPVFSLTNPYGSMDFHTQLKTTSYIINWQWTDERERNACVHNALTELRRTGCQKCLHLLKAGIHNLQTFWQRLSEWHVTSHGSQSPVTKETVVQTL